MAVMKEYPCVRKCFFQGVRYRPPDGNFEGDTLVTDLPASKIPSHFAGGKVLSNKDSVKKPALKPEPIDDFEGPKDAA